MLKLKFNFFISFLIVIIAYFIVNNIVLSEEKKPDRALKFEISMKDSICRKTSPIMITLTFKNEAEEPKKFCTYMFYDSLLKLDIKNDRGKKINFSPKLLQADKITDKDLINILPGRIFKKTFSLNRKFIETIGTKIKPGHYTIKIIYDGCSKFDPNLPNDHLESNILHLLITE